MPSNQKQKRYEKDLDHIEHHYQNQLDHQAKMSKHSTPSSTHPSPPAHYRITRHPSMTSSIMPDSDRKSCSFFIVILAVICLFLAITTITITFIFPFWAVFRIDFPSGTLASNGALNVANSQNKISLTAYNTTNSEFITIRAADGIRFDMGLWDLRTYRKLSILDITNNNLSADNMQSMRWTTGDTKSNSFVYRFLAFISLTSSTIYALQILEILHLIFTLLTFCATSVTLCLCTNKKASLAWYLVCYLLCILSFLLGLAVIVILIAWQTSSKPPLAAAQTLSLIKDFGFCFWLSVVVQILLLSTSFFILTYVIVASISLYRKHREMAKRLAKPKSNGFSNVVRIPRLHVDSSSSSRSSKSDKNDAKDPSSPINAFSNLPQMPENQQNPSYVFYTGHGNYHSKQPVIHKSEYEPPNEFYQPQTNKHSASYNHVMQSSGKYPKAGDHPYSNVLVEQVNHAYNNGPR